jgi:hypothetical protein
MARKGVCNINQRQDSVIVTDSLTVNKGNFISEDVAINSILNLDKEALSKMAKEGYKSSKEIVTKKISESYKNVSKLLSTGLDLKAHPEAKLIVEKMYNTDGIVKGVATTMADTVYHKVVKDISKFNTLAKFITLQQTARLHETRKAELSKNGVTSVKGYYGYNT